MSRIIITSPDGRGKVGLATTRAELLAAFPDRRIGWPRDISVLTDRHFADHGLAARVSQEAPEPKVAEYERAVAGDERLPDGTWRQAWVVEERLALADAKALLTGLAISIFVRRVSVSQTIPSVQEMQAAGGDLAAIELARQTSLLPKLDTARQAIQGGNSLADCFGLFNTWRDDA